MARLSQLSSLHEIGGPGHRTFGARGLNRNLDEDLKCTVSMQGGKDRKDVEPWINMKPHPCLFFFYFPMQDMRSVWECQHDFSSLYNFLPFNDKADEWDVCVQLISTVLHIHEQGYALSADERRPRPSLHKSCTSDCFATDRTSLNLDSDESVFDHVLCATNGGRPWIKICQTCTLYPLSPQRVKGDLRYLLRMCAVLGVDDPDESTTRCLRTTALCTSIDELYKFALASYSAHATPVGLPHPLTNLTVLTYWRAHWYNHRGIGMWHIGNTSEAMHFFDDAVDILPECTSARLNRVLADPALTEVEQLRRIRTLPPTSIGDACTMSLLLRLRMWRDALQFAQRVVTKDRTQGGHRKNLSRKAVVAEDWTGGASEHERVMMHLLASFTDVQKEQAHLQYIDEMAGYAKTMWQTFGLHFLVAPHFLKEEEHMNSRAALKSTMTKKELDNHEWAEFRVFGNTSGFLWRLVENLTTRCAGAGRFPMASTFFQSYPGVDIGDEGTNADLLPAHGNSGFFIDLIPPAFALLRLSQEAIDKLEPTKEPSVRKEGYSDFVNAIRVAGTGVLLHLSSDKREADAWIVQTDTMMTVASRASLVLAVKNGLDVYISFTDGGIQKFFLSDNARVMFRQTNQKKRFRPIVCLEKRQLFENTPAMDPHTFQFVSLVYSAPSDGLICYLKVKQPGTQTYALQVQWLSTHLSLLHSASVPHEVAQSPRRASIKERRRSGFERRRSVGGADPIKGRDSMVPFEDSCKRTSALTPHMYDDVHAVAPSRRSLSPLRDSTVNPTMLRRRSSCQPGALTHSHKALVKESEDGGLVDAFPIVRNDEAVCGFATRVEWWNIPMRLPQSRIPAELPRALNAAATLTVTLPHNDVALRWALSEDCLVCICLLEDMRIFVIDAVVGNLVQECQVSCPCTPFLSVCAGVVNPSSSACNSVSQGLCRSQHAPLPRDAHATLEFRTNTVFAVCTHGIASFFHLDSPTSDEEFHARSVTRRDTCRASSRRVSSEPRKDLSSDEGEDNAPTRLGKQGTQHRQNSVAARTSVPLRASGCSASEQTTVAGRSSTTCVPGRFAELNDAARVHAQRAASVASRNTRLLHERNEWLLAHDAGHYKLKPLRASRSDVPLTAPFDRALLPHGASALMLLLPLLPFVRTDGWEATCVVVTRRAVATLVDLTGSCRMALTQAQTTHRERRARCTVGFDALSDDGDTNVPPSTWVADVEHHGVTHDDDDEEDHWTSMLNEKRCAYTRPTACHELHHSPHNIQQALHAQDALVAKLDVDVRSTVSWQSLAQGGQLERREALKDYITSMQAICQTAHRVATLLTFLGTCSHQALYNALWRPLGEKLYSAPFGPCFVYTQLQLEGGGYKDDCVAHLRNFLDHRTGDAGDARGANGGAASDGYGTPVSNVATTGGELGLAMAAPLLLADCIYGDKTVMHWRAPTSVHASGSAIPRHSPIASVACTDTADVVLVTLYEGTAEIWRTKQVTAEQQEQRDAQMRWTRTRDWDAHEDAPYIFDNSTARGPLGALAPVGGQLCVTAGRELKLWDTVDGEHLGTLGWASNEPADFLFYSENCAIICVVTKHSVYVWRELELCLMASAQVVAMCAQSGSLGSSTAAGDFSALVRFRRKTMAGLRSTMTAAAMCRTGHYIALCVRNTHVVVFAHDPHDVSSEPFSRILCCCCASESGGSLSSVNHLAITATGCMLVQGSSVLQVWHLPSQQVSNAAPHYVAASRAPTPPMYTTGHNVSSSTLTLPQHTVTLLSPIPDSRLQSAVATPTSDRLEPSSSRRAVAVDILHTLADAAPSPRSPSGSCAPNSNASSNTVAVETYTSPISSPRTPTSSQNLVAPQGQTDQPAYSCTLISTAAPCGRQPNFTAPCARVQVQSPMGTQRSPVPVLCAPSPAHDDASPRVQSTRLGSVEGYGPSVSILHTPLPDAHTAEQRTRAGGSTYLATRRRPAVSQLGSTVPHIGTKSPVSLDGNGSPIPVVRTPLADPHGVASHAVLSGATSGDAWRSPAPTTRSAVPTRGETTVRFNTGGVEYASASWPTQVLPSADRDLLVSGGAPHRMPSGSNRPANDGNYRDSQRDAPVSDPNLQTKLLARTMRKEALYEAHNVQARWRLEDWRGHWVVEPYSASFVISSVDARTASLYVLPPIKEQKRTARNASTATSNPHSTSMQATLVEHLERLVPNYVIPASLTAAWMWNDIAGSVCMPATHSVLCAFAPRYSQFVVALGADLQIFHTHTDWYAALSAFRTDVFSSASVGAITPRTSNRARSIRPTSSLTCGAVLNKTPGSVAFAGEERVSLVTSKSFATRMVTNTELTKQCLMVGNSLEADDNRQRISTVLPSHKRVSFENDCPGNHGVDDPAWTRASASIEVEPSNMSECPTFPPACSLSKRTSPVTSPSAFSSHPAHKSAEETTHCFLPLVQPIRGGKLCKTRDNRGAVESDDAKVAELCDVPACHNDHASAPMCAGDDHDTSPHAIPRTSEGHSASTPCLNLSGVAMAKHARCTSKKGAALRSEMLERVNESGEEASALKDGAHIEDAQKDAGGEKKEIVSQRQPRAVRRLTAMVLPTDIGSGPVPRSSRVALLTQVENDPETPAHRPAAARRSTAIALPLESVHKRSSDGCDLRVKKTVARLSTMPELNDAASPRPRPHPLPALTQESTMANIPSSPVAQKKSGKSHLSFANNEADAQEPPSIWEATLFIDPSLIFIGCPGEPHPTGARPTLQRKKRRKPQKKTVLRDVVHKPFVALLHPSGFTCEDSSSGVDAEDDTKKEKRRSNNLARLNVVPTLNEYGDVLPPPRAAARRLDQRRTEVLAQPVKATFKRDATLVSRYLGQSLVPIVPENVLRR